MGATAASIAFTGLSSGDTFDVVEGSKIGPLGVAGTSTLVEFGAAFTQFETRVGPLGMIRTTTRIERLEGDRVRITSSGRGVPAVSVLAHIVIDDADEIRFQHDGEPEGHCTSFRRRDDGLLELSSVAPAVGGVVMVLRATRA